MPELNIETHDLISPFFVDLHDEFKAEKHIEYWLKGGRGSTKSTFATIQIILGMLKDKEANAVACRRYQNELRDTVFGQFEWTINKMGLWDYFDSKVSPIEIVFKPTGQKIVFKGADKPEKLKSINLGRGYVKYLWFEEVDQFYSMAEIRNIIQSVFRGTIKNTISIYSYNPPKSGRSWVNQEVRIIKPGKRVHHSNYTTVPRDWLGPVFLTNAEHLKKVNETAYRHEYLGEEVGTGLEVFNNLEIRQIYKEELESFDKIRQGLDWGYAIDPACFERLYFDSTRFKLFFLSEVSGINMFNRELWTKVKQFNDVQTIADSAEPKSIAEMKSYGMRIKGAKKGKGSVEYGVKFLQDMEKIIIDPNRCPVAAREFLNYALEEGQGGIVKSSFPDKENHSIDAARYALEDDMKHGQKIKTFDKRKLGLR